MNASQRLQLVCNLVDFDMDVQSVLEEPRFRVGDDEMIAVEDSIPMNVQAELARKGHQRAPPNTFFGGGQAILSAQSTAPSSLPQTHVRTAVRLDIKR